MMLPPRPLRLSVEGAWPRPAWLARWRLRPASVGGVEALFIKSDNSCHRWAVVGGHDPVLDGEDPAHGRVAIECGRCGEARRIWRRMIDDEALRYGCARAGFTGSYEPGDHVIVGSGVEYFLSYQSSAHAATLDAAGATRVLPVADLAPRLVEPANDGDREHG